MTGLFRRIVVGVSAASLLLISSCAVNPQSGSPEFSQDVKSHFKSVFDNPDPCSNNDRNIGMVVGAVVGGVVGYLQHGRKGALVGAAVGAGGGSLIGYSLDQRRCKLYRIAQTDHLKLASAPITAKKLGTATSKGWMNSDSTVGLDVQLQNQDGEFVPGTARLTPRARKYIRAIAEQYVPPHDGVGSGATHDAHVDAQLRERKVLIVAHSDDTLDPRKSARLTERRAHAVAEVFKQAGVPAHNIYYQGAGDTLPIASNGTRQGRAVNERVQIVDLPTDTDLHHYLQLRQPNGQYFGAAVTREASTGTKSPTMIVKRPHARRLRHYTGYNFGGTPLAMGTVQTIDLGSPVVHSTFSFIAEAHADEPLVVDGCIDDQPHQASPVRNLATGHRLPIRDYTPGFFGAPWLGGFHGNLVVVDKAYVPRDSGSPIPRPKLMIYKHYNGNAAAKPSYMAHVPVNVYRGNKATLYRLFVDGPIECIDLVKPNRPGNADAKLYYTQNGRTYLASGAFALQK